MSIGIQDILFADLRPGILASHGVHVLAHAGFQGPLPSLASAMLWMLHQQMQIRQAIQLLLLLVN